MSNDPFDVAVMIGGPAGSGKSTIARMLARKRGLRWYSTDAHGWSHRSRAVARGLHDEDDPSPGDFDRGPLIKEDLDQLNTTIPIAGTVVEGALVTPVFAPITRSVWLMPSLEEQRRRLRQRSRTASIDDGLLYGHRLITEQLAGTQATVINVTGRTVERTFAEVETSIESALRRLPTGHSTFDRQRLIRYGNRSLAEQLRISLDKGHIDLADRESEPTFDCECGLPTCTSNVQLRPIEAIQLSELEPGAIRAERHDA